MTPSSNLFALIKSLSKAEKRDFKLFCSRKGNVSDKNFVKLFDKIDQQDVYDETKIKKHFAGQKFIKQLTATKYYLYHLILKSSTLNIKSVHSKQSERLMHIEFLFHKKLYDQAMSLTERYIEEAKAREELTFLYTFLEWKEKLITFIPDIKDNLKLISEAAKNKQQVLKAISNQSHYKSIRAKVFGLLKDRKFVHKYQEDQQVLKEIKEFSSKNKPLTLSAEADLMHSYGTLYYHSGDYKTGLACYRQLLAFLNEHSFLAENEVYFNYFNVAQNYLVGATQLNIYDDYVKNLFSDIHRRYKDSPEREPFIARLELAILNKVQRFKEALSIAEKTDRRIRKTAINDFFVQADLWYNLAETYYWNKKYSEAMV